MTDPLPSGPVLVGVVDGQRPEVVRTAARFAAGLGAPLLLLSVAPDPYLVGEYVDPMTGGIPIGLVPREGGGRSSPRPSARRSRRRSPTSMWPGRCGSPRASPRSRSPPSPRRPTPG
ncbi:hypothetical protein Q0F99_06015 [Rathayibacter oskolensis]|uniref:hypothetical protein n=1 Tax=Rathayibacter oskolensis TaxID=1891671 RepID=UPI00265F7A86|nr:hypothetical protein [Rathayibacter oskolensis]WKK73447.1 hypothetical protein Q0F99_06015 [Rathayibacter oskolensis]